MPGTLYLASRSPRRRELLKQIGIKFDPLLLRLANPRGPDVDESQHDGGPASITSSGRHARKPHSDSTCCECDRCCIGRCCQPTPLSSMARSLQTERRRSGTRVHAEASGRTHDANCRCALAMEGSLTTAVSVSQVTLRSLTADETERYCATQALRQSRRLRDSGACIDIHRAPGRKLFRE